MGDFIAADESSRLGAGCDEQACIFRRGIAIDQY